MPLLLLLFVAMLAGVLALVVRLLSIETIERGNRIDKERDASELLILYVVRACDSTRQGR